MITDALMTFEEDMTMPDNAETDADTLDMQAAGVAGSGKLFAVGIVTTDMGGGTSIAMKVYAGAASADTLIYTGEVILKAAALKGKVLGCFALPPDIDRYIKASLITVGTPGTGNASLFITNHPVKSN